MAVTLPSISSSTGALTASGVGSGLDVKALVSQLMTLEQRPMTLLTSQEAGYQSKLSSLGTIKSSLSSLQAVANALATASTNQYSSTVGDSSILTTAPTSDASAGSYRVTVSTLAQTQKLVSGGSLAADTAIGDGTSTTLTFTLGTITSETGTVDGLYTDGHFAANATKTPVSLTIDSNNNTLTGIRDAINAANAGVTASVINDGGASPWRLTITSNETGAANSLSISASGGDGSVAALLAYDPTGAGAATQKLTQSQVARDAALSIDGLSIKSASNSVSDAIQGVTLNLTKVHPSPLTDYTTVVVQRDNSAVTPAITALINGYNALNKTVGGLTGKAASFQGDSSVLATRSKVREILAGPQSTGSVYAMMSDIGVSFQKDGSLAVDSVKFNTALSSNPNAVSALTAALGKAVSAAVTGLLGTGGAVTSKTEGLNSSIKSIQSREQALQRRLDQTQSHYQKQFAALDTLLGKMTQTSSYLTQQLASLYNPNAKG